MKYKQCNDCRYKGRPQMSYPCSRCDSTFIPLTCRECRYECIKKSIVPCKNFEWD